MIKLLATVLFYLIITTQAFTQPTTRNPLLGKWTLEKLVISPEMFFDLTDKDSTRRNFLRQYKEKNFGSAWTRMDSITVEKLYSNAMADMEKMYMNFTSDSTYEANGMDHGNGPTPDTVKATYKFNPSTMILVTTDAGITIELKVLTLNAFTLVLESSEKMPQPSPRLTFRRPSSLK